MASGLGILLECLTAPHRVKKFVLVTIAAHIGMSDSAHRASADVASVLPRFDPDFDYGIGSVGEESSWAP